MVLNTISPVAGEPIALRLLVVLRGGNKPPVVEVISKADETSGSELPIPT